MCPDVYFEMCILMQSTNNNSSAHRKMELIFGLLNHLEVIITKTKWTEIQMDKPVSALTQWHEHAQTKSKAKAKSKRKLIRSKPNQTHAIIES